MAMTRRVGRLLVGTALTAGVLVATAAPALAAPPPNDNRASADPITLGATINGTTIEATMEVGESGNSCSIGFGGDGANTVWYSITLADPLTLTASMTSATDQAVAVYDAAFAEIGCDDNAGPGATEVVTWSGAAEQQFYVSVSRFEVGHEGPFTLVVDEAATPGPDTIDATPNIDFGPVAVGASDELPLGLSNSGGAPVEVLLVASASSGPQAFGIDASSTTCPDGTSGGFVVPAMSSCAVAMTFAPEEVGLSSLTIDWEDLAGQVLASTVVTGEGTDEAPPPEIPEAPLALLLPGSTLLLGAGVYLVRRRSHRVIAD